MQTHEQRMRQALKKHFGFSEFRGGQAPAIESVLSGRDVVLVMPTGSGKSLCYQLSALLLPGVTLVISPLIALMKDQVDALEARGIAATFINSSVSSSEMAYRLDGLRQGRYKLVYVAPERFRNRRFAEVLKGIQVALFTIDEAHCISQWGHDFRPDYLNLKRAIAMLDGVRVLAVTATATPTVRDDIILQLGLGEEGRSAPVVSVTGFARPNLYLAVKRCPTHAVKLTRLMQVIKGYGAGIVYCSTRKMVERVSRMLAEEGLAPIAYHGAMSDGERTQAQNRFMERETPLVVATNAFGMGVDRGDLRFVMHWDVPGSLEAYYQEVGRAGRDGTLSWCELLYNYADVATQRFFIDGANPSLDEIWSLWQTLSKACAKREVTCTINEWAERAKLKNEMSVRTALGLIERARLIEREILPGQRSYTTRLLPGGEEALRELKRLAAGIEAKRRHDEEKLEKLLNFVNHSGCRHAYLLNYFGEPPESGRCRNCDRCIRLAPGARREHYTRSESGTGNRAPSEEQWVMIQKVLSCVARMRGRFGATRVIQVLRGEQSEMIRRHKLDGLSTFGIMAEEQDVFLRHLIEALMRAGCLSVTPDQYQLLALTGKGQRVVRRQEQDFTITWPR